MARNKFTETDVELAALEWLGKGGYSIIAESEVTSGETAAEWEIYRDAISCTFIDTVAGSNKP